MSIRTNEFMSRLGTWIEKCNNCSGKLKRTPPRDMTNPGVTRNNGSNDRSDFNFTECLYHEPVSSSDNNKRHHFLIVNGT